MVDQGILEKTLEFAPGEWLLSSYIATSIENVPIFIKADNAENENKKTPKPNNKINTPLHHLLEAREVHSEHVRLESDCSV